MTADAIATSFPLKPAREVPTSFAASIKHWWAIGEKDGAVSEERLLRQLPFYQSDIWPRTSTALAVTASSSRVTLSSHKRYINTFSILPERFSSAPKPVVVLHGYGAGLGFFFRNFGPLGQWAAQSGSPVYALDWLGMGRSARVPFTVKAKREDIPARVHEAECFFVDSLEEWRTRMGLEKMTLVGHSLGAYLSVVYALRHPTRVERLVLLSPAGVPRDPNTSAPERELTDDQEMMSHSSTASSGSSVESASRQGVRRIREEQKEAKRNETRTQKLFTWMWEEGWSPFQLVRTLTVFGPMLVGKYSSRRFSGLTEEETRNMNDYITNITLAKGSGEYCISHILAPFAHARMPLIDRIAALKIPVTFVYGDHDWMDPEGGRESVERLSAAGNKDAKMFIIKNAGHHVYLDNPHSCNDLILKELDRMPR